MYWRRRAIAACLLALVVAVVIWALNSGGSGGGKGANGPTGTHTPVATITAGPAPTGTHISGRPGGRDTAPTDSGSNGGTDGGSSAGATPGDTTGGTDGTDGGSTEGTDGTSGAASGTAAGTTSGTSSGTSSGAGGSGGPLAVGSTLPDCAPGAVRLSLTSVQNAYSPDETPAFRLTATNSGATTCKVDFGPAKAVFTITAAADTGSHVWASDDCPSRGSYLLQVPAHGTTTYVLHWNEKNSSPQCAAPKGKQAQPGTYLVQAQLPGYGAKQVSFVLTAD